ncbi:MAG: hypothetical protein EXR50_08225 [Dehalococcoidia bacterium]|nr:hypothetical protein [Dehalococcoidia bacterium]
MTLPIVSHRALSVWRRNRDVFRSVWRGELPFTVVEPLFILAVMGFGLGGYVALGGTRYLEFIAPGVLASYAMWAAGGECSWGTYVRMNEQKTFDAIIATPVSIEDVIAGEVLWGTTRSIMSCLVVLSATLLFGVGLSPWAVLVPAAVLL